MSGQVTGGSPSTQRRLRIDPKGRPNQIRLLSLTCRTSPWSL